MSWGTSDRSPSVTKVFASVGMRPAWERDPEQHRPPRLSWENLIRALDNEGIVVGEDDLIAAPLAVEFAPEVRLLFEQA